MAFKPTTAEAVKYVQDDGSDAYALVTAVGPDNVNVTFQGADGSWHVANGVPKDSDRLKEL